jgi:hypothetical protein
VNPKGDQVTENQRRSEWPAAFGTDASTADESELLTRIQLEYVSMPSLRLTLAQARRFWGLTHSRCESTFHRLVDSGFLAQEPDGTFARRRAGRPQISIAGAP